MDRQEYHNMCWIWASGSLNPQGTCGVCSIFRDVQAITELVRNPVRSLGLLRDLRSWARSGCPICKYIESELLWEDDERNGSLDDSHITLKWDMENKNNSIELSSVTVELMRSGTGHPGNVEAMLARRVPMRCFSEEENILAKYIKTRSVVANVDQQPVFSKAKAWINDCLRNHTCRGNLENPPTMPTRVIDVTMQGNGQYVRLYESHQQPGHYVALSYVWGGDQPYKTTRANLDEYKRRIDINTLPLTIKDAIHCTRMLGLSFLWVDALCIIQDDDEDKTNEIKGMSDVYRNSVVTVSAAAARNCHEGFFQPRDHLSQLAESSFAIPMAVPKDFTNLEEPVSQFGNFFPGVERIPGPRRRYMLQESWQTSILWLARSDTVLEAPDVDEEVISGRGWTLQESWLSSRLLFFGSSQPCWQCAELSDCFGGIITWKVEQSQQQDIFRETSTPNREDIAKLIRSWDSVVSEFTRRDLGESSDKLRALDGIVREYIRVTGDTYVAGIWKSDLLHGLSWFQTTADTLSRKMKLGLSRRCPSWSWAKVDGPIQFSFAERSRVSIISVSEVDTSVNDGFLVATGEITLRGPLTFLTKTRLCSEFQVWTREKQWPAFTSVIHPDGASDSHEFSRASDADVFYFFELSSGLQAGVQNVARNSFGLVLREVGEHQKKFRRIGFFMVASEHVPGWDDVVLNGALTTETPVVEPTRLGIRWAHMLEITTITII